MTGIDRRLSAGLLALAAALLVCAPSASSPAAERVQPAVRAADQLRRDGEGLRRADEAVKRAEEAARAAVGAASEAATAARLAKQAAERAEAAAEAARRARDAAAGKALTPPAASAVDGRPVFSGDRPAPTAAARAAEPRTGAARVLRVGPDQRYRAPSEAARDARDGDVIEIEAGTYAGDVAVWRADDLVIRGIDGRPQIKAAGRSAEDKAIWVIKGRNATIENVEMSGARVDDHNGAAIRLEGSSLTVRDCYIHHNEMGLMTGEDPVSDVLIEDSEFAYNTVNYDRYHALGHNIYVGGVRSFTLRGSYVHHAFTGHNVKSRARVSRILYNRLMDETDGRSSYIIDLPNGGEAYLIGNLIQQGRDSDNWSMINFLSKRGYGHDQLHLLHNTLVSDRANGLFIQSRSELPVILVNNILVGHAKPVDGEALMVSNLIVGNDRGAGLLNRVTDKARRLLGGGGQAAESARNVIAADAGFRDRARFDYRLVRGSPAVDAGSDPTIAWDGAARPDLVFAPPHGTAPRPVNGRPDIGAYELTSQP